MKTENNKGLNQWIQYGIIAIFLILISILFLNTTPYYDLFTGDQPTYYPHGMYLAGRDYLQNDWLSANYKSYHITFTLLVYALDVNGGLELGIEMLDIGFRLLFLTSVWLIIFGLWNRYFIKEDSSPLSRAQYPLVIFFVFAFSINPVNPLSKIFESFNWNELSEFWKIIGDLGGFIKQWLYGYRVNPASFAVFILLGLSLLLFHRWKFAALCLGLASLFHISFVIHCGIIILTIIVYLMSKKEKRVAFHVLIIFSLMIIPLVIYFLTGYLTDTTAESNQLLMDIAGYSGIKNVWGNAENIHLAIIILASILLWRRGKRDIFPWVFNINLAYVLVGTGLGWFFGSKLIGILMPFRAGIYLYPIALLVLFMAVLYYTLKLLDKLNPKFKYLIIFFSILLLFIGLKEYGLFSQKRNLRYKRTEHQNYNFYEQVKKKTTPEDIILIPVEDGSFRLDAERAVYVDSINYPGWGTVLVEWRERIKLASAFYDLVGSERQKACQDLGVDYYVLYGIEPSEIEPVVGKRQDKTLIDCPGENLDN